MPRPGGHHPDRRAPGQAEDAGQEEQRGVGDRLAEAHQVEHHLGAVVRRVVGELVALDLLDALAGAGQGERQQVAGEARVDAGDVDGRVACLGGGLDLVDDLLRHGAPGELQGARCRADDVDAGLEQLADVVGGLDRPGVAHRAVDDALRLGGDERVEVADRRDAGGHGEPGQLAGVLADLVRARDADRDQLEPVVADELAQGQLPALPVATWATRMRHAGPSLAHDSGTCSSSKLLSPRTWVVSRARSR